MIPFNIPRPTGQELANIAKAVAQGHLCGDGPFTQSCQKTIEQALGGGAALLTHSCTGALEMAMLLADLEPGDEVIMPSFTFVSTANAVVLRRAVPVFVDIDPITKNIDPTQAETAITSRTRAIIVVHYAGVPCEMDAINAIAAEHNLLVVEDAAQAYLSSYKGRAAGLLGDIACFSFHETKNIVSGEGGALLLTDTDRLKRAEILWEKGTDRKQFHRGHVDKYTWVDIGSSFLPSDLIAAFLLPQLENARAITDYRLALWQRYQDEFAPLQQRGDARVPSIPTHVQHNGHIYYLQMESVHARDALIAHLKAADILSVFHYVPLHSAPAGMKYGRAASNLQHTVEAGDTIVRLPLSPGLAAAEQDHIISQVYTYFN